MELRDQILPLPFGKRPESRPAEPQMLADETLLTILLGWKAGTDRTDRWVRSLLNVLDTEWGRLTATKLAALPGIDALQAAQLLSAFELARRRIRPLSSKIRSAADVHPLVRHLASRKQETFATITLNGAHEVIAVRVVTIGTLTQALVHPREVFVDAVADRAAAIVAAHNHPSGDLKPSPHDLETTKRLRESGTLLGIHLLDHLVFDESRYLSMAEEGLL